MKTEELCHEIIWWHNKLYGHDITLEQLRSKSRVAPIVACRADCMRRIREVRKWSYPVIGKWFGGFDHTSVMHHTSRKDVVSRPIKNSKRLNLAELRREAELNRWQRILAKSKRARGLAGVTTEEHTHEIA